MDLGHGINITATYKFSWESELVFYCHCNQEWLSRELDEDELANHLVSVHGLKMFQVDKAVEMVSEFYQPFRCRRCGEKELPASWLDGDDLRLAGLCRTCYFWDEKIRWKLEGNKDVVIANHVHYMVRRDGEGIMGGLLGYGGRRWLIKWQDGREMVTHNLWCQGPIPEEYWDQLPDNAVLES